MSSRGVGGASAVLAQVHLPILLIPVGPFYIGWVLAEGRLLPGDASFVIALVSILPFLALGTVLFNDAYDVDVDPLSRRKGTLPSSEGGLGRDRLLALSGVSFAASMIAAAMVNVEFLATIGSLAALAVLYSVPPVQLSRRPGLDLLANAVGIGVLCTVAGWVASDRGSLPPFAWLVTSAFGTGTFFLLPTLMDHESDEAGDKQTVVVELGWERACLLGLALISLADVGIVYLSLSSTILKPTFLWVAWPVILGEVAVFPLLYKRRDLLRTLTGAMSGLLFLGNLLIVLSYLDLIGPF